ncbi:MAG: TRAP transporter substrate-binding protein [Rhodobacteraceae bacterium]|nr:TRAP transporter substrate-binding protein [Paracoccaceae bacterium]
MLFGRINVTTPIRTTLAAALALALGASGAFAQDVTLRVHHFLSPNGSVPKFFIVPWAEKVMEDSDGRIKVEVFPSMQLGGTPPSLYDQARDGVVDVIWTVPSYQPGRFPEAEVFELPFMTSRSGEKSSRAAWDFTQEFLTERMGDVHLVAVHVHGPGVIHTKDGPITSLDDFDGLTLRGPSRQAVRLLEQLGATTVGMPVPQFPEALSRGVVQGGVIPWEVVPALRVEELAENHTEIGGDFAMYNTFFVFAMNRASYERMPEDLRAVIDANSGREASAWAGRAMDTGDGIAREAIEARGNTIVTMPDDVLEAVQAVGEAVTETWIAEVTAAGLPGAEMVARARELVAQYND